MFLCVRSSLTLAAGTTAACLQAFSDEAPTSLHLSDCSLGAWAFQCPIHERAEPSRQPTQMLCLPTKGQPPTLCCLNDSPAHVTAKKAPADCGVYDQRRLQRVYRKTCLSFCKTFHYCRAAAIKRRGLKVGSRSVISDGWFRKRDCFDKLGLKVLRSFERHHR